MRDALGIHYPGIHYLVGTSTSNCLGALVGSDVPILEHRDSCNMGMSL